MRLTDEQIQKAVEWWAQFLVKEPTFVEQHENAQLDDSQFLAMMILDIMKKDSVPTGDINKFKDAFKVSLKENNPRFIGVDYHPCSELYSALVIANYNPELSLPWKTRMWFTEDGKVLAAKGYGAESVEL